LTQAFSAQKPSAVQASVVIACYTERRWPQLTTAIESAITETGDAARVFVAVDHNEVLAERLRAKYADVQIMANARSRGASGARNTAAFVATTPYVVFLDDDSWPEAGWLESLLEPFIDNAIVGVGGKYEPVWETSRPFWFPDEFGWVVGASYKGMPTETAVVRNAWGGNMAVRRSAFVSVDGFREGFGKLGSASRPEDTDLSIRMGQMFHDATWMYVPSAVVNHFVPRERSGFRFFVKRCYNEGRGKVEMARLLQSDSNSNSDSDDAVLDTEQNYLRRTLPRGVLSGLGDVFRGPARSIAILIGLAASVAGAISAYGRKPVVVEQVPHPAPESISA
jgi:GT2 family glycosyltransferase